MNDIGIDQDEFFRGIIIDCESPLGKLRQSSLKGTNRALIDHCQGGVGPYCSIALLYKTKTRWLVRLVPLRLHAMVFVERPDERIRDGLIFAGSDRSWGRNSKYVLPAWVVRSLMGWSVLGRDVVHHFAVQPLGEN